MYLQRIIGNTMTTTTTLTLLLLLYSVLIETKCCKTVQAVASVTSVSQTVDAAGVLNAMTFTVSSPPR